MLALQRQATGEADLPELNWSYDVGAAGATLQFSSEETLAKARVWTAEAETRDFRQSRWRSTTLFPNDDGAFEYTLQRPSTGYAAVIGEYEFEREGSRPFFLSTNVRIVAASVEDDEVTLPDVTE